jgi:hypothetical protein
VILNHLSNFSKLRYSSDKTDKGIFKVILGSFFDELRGLSREQILAKKKEIAAAYEAYMSTKTDEVLSYLKRETGLSDEELLQVFPNITNEYESGSPSLKIQIAKYFVASQFYRVEQFKIFYGHPNQYARPDAVQKRLSGYSGAGTHPQEDSTILSHLKSPGTNAFGLRDAFLLSQGQPQPEADDTRLKTLKYALVNDLPVDSTNVTDEFKELYQGGKATDGATLMNLDAYRRFRFSIGERVSQSHQALFLWM